ncbi:LysM peptidoglycan-binding domain-containing protein [Staphylococcus hyicus]|uniref:LysM peptidoglycan-binding domain-containing protein n=1 Tax=Staphylococcus hyicus TaxID=1284 RepID=UPI00211BE6C8|nr:LysM peptidoglycan-binding domain-containing protein [Staphylococcus hyicus]MCQ9290819.1 LysM peptidoglycan-binding domain-containing protein [Staphylococcus hyicus]MCQ9306061.1 LysM peptidoglycan-binding domain-containing protein [Staphylococcus hyicus]MCQ9308473.1 LysM peptidoglycan-binding domain-containing protein [Staphylococcus hyicus]MCQ9310895.1 LysM peptidoglycan-binding domain-containing protein [Staphylococcus hyicus]
MSKDNFKDDFERNRQEIKPKQSEPSQTDVDEDTSSFDVRDEHQHFPPRNASRRHRKRDLGPTSDRNQPSESNDKNELNEGQGKRPGILGGFVNKKQSSDETNHASHDQNSADTSNRGEKIRDYAKEDTQNKHKDVRDDGRPEHHGGQHREQIHSDKSTNQPQAHIGDDKKIDSPNDSTSAHVSNHDAQERTRNMSASPRDKRDQATITNDSQKLENQSKHIDDKHRKAKQPDATGKGVHTSKPDLKGKKVAAGVGAAGVAGAAAKHPHDQKDAHRGDHHNENRHANDPKHDRRHNQTQDERQSHKGKKVAAGVGAAGVAGAAAKHHHDQKDAHRGDHHNENRHANDPKHDRRHNQTQDERQSHKGKKVAAGVGAAGVAGAAAKHHHDQKADHAQKEQQHQKATETGAGTTGVAGAHRGHGHDNHSNEKRGGCFKRIIPLLAALLLLGALAIFGGIYLFNQGSNDNHDKDNQTELAKKDNAKDKEAKDKAADKDQASKENDASKDKKTTEEAASQNNDASQQNNQQNGINQQDQSQQNTQNTQNPNQQNQAGGQSHTVTGNENLYRIAIRYYGNGSPENVEKIRRANGISGNNISNGQHLIIP